MENSLCKCASTKKLFKTSRKNLHVKKKSFKPVFADPLRVQKHRVSSVVRDPVAASFVSEPRESKTTISYKGLTEVLTNRSLGATFDLLKLTNINKSKTREKLQRD